MGSIPILATRAHFFFAIFQRTQTASDYSRDLNLLKRPPPAQATSVHSNDLHRLGGFPPHILGRRFAQTQVEAHTRPTQPSGDSELGVPQRPIFVCDKSVEAFKRSSSKTSRDQALLLYQSYSWQRQSARRWTHKSVLTRDTLKHR
jgi:hypothetical protein